MRIALWILLAVLLTYVTGAALHNAARSGDRETLVGNVLLSWCVGWYTVSSWRRAYGATRRRVPRVGSGAVGARASLGIAKSGSTTAQD
ncbi:MULTISPECIES: hypothetical protein [Streptomyces]|uniref:hypothetical protein n=1 Tax=Streptomyces TaxID=1883 RepID=UPI00200E2480|nr:hypothetical protein [Streptomyces sp. LRE541]UPZ32990.1 hypothetical protein MUK60_37495 [Streptomyces sp. LRE541]